jgi:hypothetical protein
MNKHTPNDSHYEILGRLNSHQLLAHNEYHSAVSLYRICADLHRKVSVAQFQGKSEAWKEAQHAHGLSYNIATRAKARAVATGLEYAGSVEAYNALDLV